MKVKLKNVIAQFPKVYVPEINQKYPDSGKTYSIAVRIDKKDEEQVKLVKAAIVAEAKNKFGDKASAMLASFKPVPQKYCLKDGDEALTEAGEPAAPGFFILTARRSEKSGAPRVVDRNNKPLDASSGKPYGGAIVNVSVDIYCQDKANQGIRCSLVGVQFVADGPSLGGARQPSVDEFETLGDGDVVDMDI